MKVGRPAYRPVWDSKINLVWLPLLSGFTEPKRYHNGGYQLAILTECVHMKETGFFLVNSAANFYIKQDEMLTDIITALEQKQYVENTIQIWKVRL